MFDLSSLDLTQKANLAKAAKARRFNKLLFYFHTESIRKSYVKHMELLNSHEREVGFVAANRVGKSLAGSFVVATHLTGNYPSWWKGRRFLSPPTVWVAGSTYETTRDIVQKKLLGDVQGRGFSGEGLIPKSNIKSVLWRRGIAELADKVDVQHSSGMVSTLRIKSYQQGRTSFEGVAVDFVWLDEEPPYDIYSECLFRTATKEGSGVILTFTPLKGVSDTVLSFSAESEGASKLLIRAGWNDAPHLTPKAKKELIASCPPHELEARTKGIPSLGSGAIYPIPLSQIQVNDFVIPDRWNKVYCLDVGWNRTAALFFALDPDSGTYYIYSEHYQAAFTPRQNVKSMDYLGVKELLGHIDPAAKARQQGDGKRMIDLYSDEGLTLTTANNAVESGLSKVYNMLYLGKIKVFKSLLNFESEYRIYRRDEGGKIVKKNDHLMDCLRYFVNTAMYTLESSQEDVRMPLSWKT